ncbi:MAG: transglycosylase [Actinophytocola sp.]|nr:transglycosylase [Actinophytocola sp.]
MSTREREPRRSTVTTLACVCGLAVTSLAASAQPHDAATVPPALPNFAAHPPTPHRYPLPSDEPPADFKTSSISARLHWLAQHIAYDAQPGHAITLDDGTIPQQVLDAYRRAATMLSRSDATCQLHWSVLAGIGRIESGHAWGGALLGNGRTASPILGPRLDGSLVGTATIHDSTGGQFDGDAVWERAVGPMQFLPSTWLQYGQDGNGDGVRDPHNIYDAALGSAVYLCAGARDLSQPSQLNQALYSYNPSWDYVRAVLAWADHYAGLGPQPSAGRIVTHTLAATRGSADTAAAKPAKQQPENEAATQQDPPKSTASKTPTRSPGHISGTDNEEPAGNTDESTTPNTTQNTKTPGGSTKSPSVPKDDNTEEPASPDTTQPTEPSEPTEPTEPDATDDPSCDQPDNTTGTDDEETDKSPADGATDKAGHDADTDGDAVLGAEDSEDSDTGEAPEDPAGDGDETTDGTEPDDGTTCEQPDDPASVQPG